MKNRRWPTWAILAATPLLAGPYFPGCQNSHGAYPLQCQSPGTPGCSAELAVRRAQVEQDFRWAETTSVMLIGGSTSAAPARTRAPTRSAATDSPGPLCAPGDPSRGARAQCHLG